MASDTTTLNARTDASVLTSLQPRHRELRRDVAASARAIQSAASRPSAPPAGGQQHALGQQLPHQPRRGPRRARRERASSCWRDEPRASISPATLAQAISSTTPTTASIVKSPERA